MPNRMNVTRGCDAASLGRDAALLVAAGWTLEWSRLIDMFPDTPHVEVVGLVDYRVLPWAAIMVVATILVLGIAHLG